MKNIFLLLLPLTLFSCASTDTKESLGEFVDNSAISSKIKTKFISDKQVPSTAIHIESFKGKVILSGFVDSEFQKERAINIAKKTSGVKEVMNKIVVK